VNSCSHAIVVEQLMNLIRIPKQVPTSNQLKVQRTCHKKPQSSNAYSSMNSIVNKSSLPKFDKSLGLDASS
jgi:hypothetical protein